MSAELIALLERLYNTEAAARALLISVGYPPESIPAFGAADTFWPEVVPGLDNKVSHGRLKIAKIVADKNPGAADAEAVVAGLAEQVVTEDEADTGADSFVRPPGWRSDQALGNGGGTPPRNDPPLYDKPPPPPAAPPPAYGTGAGGTWCPTLMLEFADLPDQFLTVTRDLVGDNVDLLYITPEQSAVSIPDPGDQDEAVRVAVQARMRTYDPDCWVTYRKFPFRPYAYRTLTVYGPDTSEYKVPPVPATFTPEDIAAAYLRTTSREAGTSQRDGLVRMVVDYESANVRRRLDPYATLHECGVKEGDVLRVAPDAIAGSLSPLLRVEAQLRAAAQIRGYAAQRSEEFAILAMDDAELPGRITVRVSRKGLAPPADFDSLLARYPADRVPTEDLIPVPVKEHQISIHFPVMFPLVAPCVVFETPVFHPNVRHAATADLPAGALQFHPLLLRYRPEYDMAHICEMVTSVAAYRDYDFAEGPGVANLAAARWAATDTGQAVIVAIGGSPRADVTRKGDRRPHPPWMFLLRLAGGEADGH